MKNQNDQNNTTLLKTTIKWLHDQVILTGKALRIARKQNNKASIKFNETRANELADRILHTDREMVAEGLICSNAAAASHLVYNSSVQ